MATKSGVMIYTNSDIAIKTYGLLADSGYNVKMELYGLPKKRQFRINWYL